MHFEWTDTQRQLADSVERLLAQTYPFEHRRAIAAAEPGWDEATWTRLVELGLTALPVPEAHGGFGGTWLDLLQPLQALGRALSLEPFLASAVLATQALRHGGDATAQARWLPRLASGQARLAWAHDEPAARHARHHVACTANLDGAHWRLSGAKCRVLHAQGAQAYLISARVHGQPDDEDGLALFEVAAEAPGLQGRHYRLLDDTPAGDLTLADTPATPLADPSDAAHARRALDATLDAGTAAVCADIVGTMAGAYQLTTGYLRTRQQFGRAIGENQALRHRAAEMLVALESARSMALAAALALDHPDEPESRADLLRAKLLLGRQGRWLCEQAIQLHGGIGMTLEYAVGHHLRRLAVRDQLFGDTDEQGDRLAQHLLHDSLAPA